MKKWNLKKRIALLLAVMMFIMNCIPAYAEEIEGTADSDLSTISSEAPETTEDSDLSSDSAAEEENEDNADETDIEDSALSEDTVDTYSVSGEEALTEEPLTDDAEVLSDNEEESVPVLRSVVKDGGITLQSSATATGLFKAGASSLSDNDFTQASGYKWARVGTTLYISGNTPGVSNNVTAVGEFLTTAGEDPANITLIQFIDNDDGTTYNLKNEAFKNFTGLISFEVSSSIEEIGFGVFLGCTNLISFTVNNNDNYIVDPTDTCMALYSKGYETLIAIPPGRALTFTINSATKYIQLGAAQESKIRGQLIIPKSVEIIQPYAFYGCPNLSKVIFDGRDETSPSEISCCSDIGDYAFANNGSLTKVEIPDVISSNNLKGRNIFSDDYNLQIYYYVTSDYSGVRDN